MDIKPNFYDEFHCIADQCSMTCCMQWKIAVDENTVSKWKRTSLDGKRLDASVRKNGREGIIKLDKRGYCPYLEEGLCRLVTTFGEDMLSETCHTFPREIHEFDDRRELSLVSCCPAVIDFLHNSDELTFRNLRESSGDIYYMIRNLMMDIVENREYDIHSALLMAFYILLDLYEKEEITPADIEELSRLAEDILENNTDMHMDAFKKELSVYEPLFRKYLVSEIFTNMLIPDSDLEAMVVMFQWICMEYAVIRQGIFLKWFSHYDDNNAHPLSYDTVRDYIVVIARMTGYDQDDIYEYMENSFRDILWEWSYLWLIMGGFVR